MATKIKSLTIVNGQGVNYREIGEVYEGLLLDRIVDRYLQFPDAFHSMYAGETADGDTVFEAINCPVDVTYIKCD